MIEDILAVLAAPRTEPAAQPAAGETTPPVAPTPVEESIDRALEEEFGQKPPGAPAPPAPPTAGKPAAPRADEPPLAEGITRLYHGSAEPGRYEGPAWFSTNRQYAEGYREGAELQYVDVPTEWVNKQADPDQYGQTPDKGFTWNVELDSSVTGKRQPLIGE